jgi:tRNA 2-thiouridine synthesizing protein A
LRRKDQILRQYPPRRSRKRNLARRNRRNKRIDTHKRRIKWRKARDPLYQFRLSDHQSLAKVAFVMYARPASGKGQMAEKILNLRGLKCPLPTLRVRKALGSLKSGEELVAECTDPLTEIDIPNLINQTGDALLATSRADKMISFRIRKK